MELLAKRQLTTVYAQNCMSLFKPLQVKSLESSNGVEFFC